MSDYINLTAENIDEEHICCAISDPKHQNGVSAKKSWLKDRLNEGHVFRKLNENGKVFIEYAPIENAWVPVTGSNYNYIYCLWVSGKFKGNGHAKDLLQYCIDDSKEKGKSGICILTAKKKKPYISEKKILKAFGFEVADSADDYELMALKFDDEPAPAFSDSVKKKQIDSSGLTIYHTNQCPFIPNCVKQVKAACEKKGIELTVMEIDTCKKAKEVPSVFNNWAAFYNGKFLTHHLLNENYLKKELAKVNS